MSPSGRLRSPIVATVALGALVGLLNGLLIGYLRLRAFLTTLVMLTLTRAIVAFLLQIYSVRIASSDVESDLWDFLGAGSILGVPVSFVVLIVVAIAAHIILTRLRIGWRIMAVGGSRRAVLQRWNSGARNGVSFLCRLRPVGGACRRALCGAAFRHWPRHRPRPRTHGRDRGASGRQQRRRRARVSR